MPSMTRRWSALVAVAVLAASLVALAAPTQPPTMKSAKKLFDQKNYKEAAAAYEALVKAQGPQWRDAAEQLILCDLRLQLYDDATTGAEDYVKRTAGTPYEARAERLTGNLYMLLPHWGTRSGGVFHRGVYQQGIYLQSWRYDKKHAVQHLERARDLYAKYDADPAALPDDLAKGWHDERIDCDFDLANTLARFSIYDDQAYYWYHWWGERDDTLARTAGETDFDEGYNWWQWTRKRPIGLRIGPDGKPVWPRKPAAYSPTLGDDQKLLFLFAEVRGLDHTEDGHYAALSTYRQAMLARKRFGMDRLNYYVNNYYEAGKHPLKKELEKFSPWTLGDHEALVLAGGQVRRVTLPAQFDVLALLRTVYDKYPKGGAADQARYGAGLYYQSRQQYTKALTAYEALRETFPRSDWSKSAVGQIDRIKAPQVQISQLGVQAPGRPIELKLSYRNLSKVYFVARRFDVEGLLKELHAHPPEDHQPYWRWQQELTSWSNLLISDYGRNDQPEVQLVAKYLGEEIARWTDQVKDDGSHRYAEATVQAPLQESGAYVVYAYAQEPPAADKAKKGLEARLLGQSRAVTALTDLAFVGKRTSDGNLYYIADAVNGSPVPGAAVDVLETWNTWDQKARKWTYHHRRTELTSDKDGMALLKQATTASGANVHLIVTAPKGRLAWSGMEYLNRYGPSRQREGMFAYAITDRPVYRPQQTVRYKVWLREARQGVLQNIPHRQVEITIYDPRGNQLQKVTKRTDDFGGLDGELVLPDDATLGVYRLEVRGQQYAGGENFRVEEYKKPEFEVTVEPSTTHAKLGSKVEAIIRAKYYFGAPVTEGTVSYKVFREEFTYTSYPAGRWDWLYGPGYGYPWYSYEWFPWWGKLRSCWAPPAWWWGYRPSNPVRELVKQGSGPIGADGTLKVRIDTAPALKNYPDRDERYVIEAEVTDASRRTITGQGDVKVTRQAFYALVNSDRGYYRPREEMQVTVRCVTPDGKPVKTDGVVSVSRVLFRGPNNADMKEKEIKRWKASTDADGVLSFRMSDDRSDLLKFTFTAPDQWGGTVEGYGLVWVCGADFDGRLYKFNELELITDKRTYAPGDVCHLMINTKNPDSYVLFAPEVDNGALLSYRLLHLTNGHAIVDVPIKEGDKPNFFVEATTVHDMHVYQQAQRINVPPAGHVLDVTVTSDKPEYKPGEEATVHVKAVTADGKPADVQVALSAFDKSILYIQPEYTPQIAAFYYGRLRHHSPNMTTNLLDQFAVQGTVQRPFLQLYPLPPCWQGFWGAEHVKWWSLAQEEFDKLKGAERQMAFGGATRFAASDGVARRETLRAAPAPMLANAAAAGAPVALEKAAAKQLQDRGAAAPAAPLVQPTVRQNFADTAVWLPSIQTGPTGETTATFKMPENLTTWKLNAYAMSRETQVGQASTEAVTTKNLLVRLEAPRFFMEYDQVVLSAIVHNYLKAVKTAHVSIELPAENLELMKDYPATVDVNVPENGQVRVDWRVRVLKEGQAAVTVKALTNEESDAMRMTFPVLVHGMTKQDSYTGAMAPEPAQATQTVEFTVPEKRRPDLTRLEVQFSPSLVGAMLDALPYCLDYPYGCTEQTVSRFLPAVLTLKTLRNMGISLEDVKKIRGRMDEVRRTEKGEHIHFYADNPVFDSAELQKIIAKGLKRIAGMQHGDGGWAWWTEGESSPYLTSYVLNALVSAQEADVAVDQNMIERGLRFLSHWESAELKKKTWSAGEVHAFVAYVLSLKGRKAGDCVDRLFAGRDDLNLYGKALLAMTLANLKDADRAALVLRNIMQYKQENKETGIAWFRTPRQGWWYWWNNDIETNAWILRAIVRIDPKSPVAPRLVKWLLNNRRNGYYWRSTRDTTLCVSAMSDFVVASGEGRPDYTLTLSLDGGAVVKKVRINKDNFFTYDNQMVVEGVALAGGKHTLTITKDGPGALYWNAYVRYFTKEQDIKASGLQLKVQRRYYVLKQMPFKVKVEGSEGQPLSERRLRYERVPLKEGDKIESGDLLQVELQVDSDNDYTYLVFEDPKPAGCEPVELRSGGQGQEGFYSYMELRDTKVAFFVGSIGRGRHLLRYRYRAEIPGVFHALPAVVRCMYVPELRGNSDEAVVQIVDKPLPGGGGR